jgi:hypothetical protein
MATELKLESAFWDDQEWGIQHYGELVDKYRNQWVAIVDQRVVSHGYELSPVEGEASQKTGRAKGQIALIYVEAGNQIF